tara:strand:- start:764 stop:1354 length:591 start_codon:yes stop_codon:yes gene_type:complete
MYKKIIFQNLILNFVLIFSAQSAESGGMPQLNTEFWISQIFWLIITFGALFIVLSKIILPKISNNLESRKSQILENIEKAEKQREESENKIKEFDKIILDTKIKAKNYLSEARQKILQDINKKKETLESEINKEIDLAEKEINELKKNAPDKINKIAIETSSDLLKQIIGVEVNKSSLTAIVEDLSKKNKDKYYGI